jgi:hypothetical protein
MHPRSAAVVSLLTALLVSQAAVARPSAPAVAVAGIDSQSFVATVDWTVDRPARVSIAVGSGTAPAVWTPVVRAPRAGRYTTQLSPLEPQTTYRAIVTAIAGGRPATAETTVKTGGMPTRAKGRATPRGLKVNTKLFFPRMVFRQCPSAFPASIVAGINLFMGTSCGPPQRSMAALAGRALLVPDVGSRADGPSVLGWHQPDEADVTADRPEAIPLLPPSSRTGRPTFLTLSNHAWSGAAQLRKPAGFYPGLVARSEIVGIDVYPLQSFCKKGLLAAVYEAQRELVALARGKTTFQWIEADPMGVCFGLDPSPAIVRAETWMAIAGGARAIGWFPENWKPAVRAEITRLSTEIRSLAPALLGAEVQVTVEEPSPVVAGGRARNGALYVIAVNPTFAGTSARISVPELGTRPLRVLGEGREVRPQDGVFVDRFRGLQARVYVAPPPGFPLP